MFRIALAAGSTLLLAGPLAAQAPDALVARIEALEAKVNALEARNHELEAAARPITAMPVPERPAPDRIARGVSPGVSPTFASSNPAITVQPILVMQFDYAAYHERAGGYDYDSGTDIRRGRFGFEGTAFRDFRYRINAEFLKNSVNLLDAFVQYTAIPHVTLTVGQHKTPYSLEANSQDWFGTFLERGMAIDSFIGVAADRRVGASILYETGALTASVGAFGANETITRNPQTPDETRSIHGRIAWEPSLGRRASASYRNVGDPCFARCQQDSVQHRRPARDPRRQRSTRIGYGRAGRGCHPGCAARPIILAGKARSCSDRSRSRGNIAG